MATESFVVQDDSYWQALSTEYVPSAYFNGTVAGYRAIQSKLRVREKVTEYRGYTADPTSIDGSEVTTGGASGATFTFTQYEKRVQRRRVNEAGFWRATVTERWQALYCNVGGSGWTWTAGAPASAF